MDDLEQMRSMLAEVCNAADQLDSNLRTAIGPIVNGELNGEFREDIEFDVQRLNIFARGVRDAWSNYD